MLSLLTPAKINLFLNIRQPRGDGYHEIVSVMQAVQLWDQLTIEPRNGHELEFTCNLPEFENDPDNNLVVRAYNLFWETTRLPRLGLHVHLEKRIPTQAGLGGGSSDAAAMLIALNHLSFAGLTSDHLRRLGAELGSDVPFFITGGTAIVRGRGEEVQPVERPVSRTAPRTPGGDATSSLHVVIVKPKNLNVSTVEAYNLVRRRGSYEDRSPDHLLMSFGKRRIGAEELDSYLWNDFEKPLFQAMPQFRDMAEKLRASGIRRPLLCGSGSAMAGLMDYKHQHRSAVNAFFPPEEYDVYWTRTHDGGVIQPPAKAKARFNI